MIIIYNSEKILGFYSDIELCVVIFFKVVITCWQKIGKRLEKHNEEQGPELKLSNSSHMKETIGVVTESVCHLHMSIFCLELCSIDIS